MFDSIPTAQEPVHAPPPTTDWLKAANSGVVASLERLEASSAQGAAGPEYDKWGTYLHRAAAKGHVDAVRWILQRLCPKAAVQLINQPSETLHHTALHAACHCGHGEVVQLLLDAGAAHDLPDKWGRAALHHAAAQSRADAVQRLLTAGASTEPKDKNDRTAAQFAQRAAATAMGARQRDANRTAKVLEEAVKTERAWWKAIRREDPSAMRSHLQAAPQLAGMRTGPSKRTPLQHACGLAGPHVVSMVGLLLEHGADVHDPMWHTEGRRVYWCLPLHRAAMAHVDNPFPSCIGRVDAPGVALVKALLLHGAVAEAVDSEGHTALQVARQRLQRLLENNSVPRIEKASRSAQPLFSLLERAERQAHARRRWRLAARVAALLAPWHARAVERAYAPGGIGFEAARAEFEGHADAEEHAEEGEEGEEGAEGAEGAGGEEGEEGEVEERARKSQRVS